MPYTAILAYIDLSPPVPRTQAAKGHAVRALVICDRRQDRTPLTSVSC
jgi:hypothetical protein